MQIKRIKIKKDGSGLAITAENPELKLWLFSFEMETFLKQVIAPDMCELETGREISAQMSSNDFDYWSCFALADLAALVAADFEVLAA